MKIIDLTLPQYMNYSNIHSRRNFGQTVEYSMLNFNTQKKKLFLGLIDDNNNICAATLILIHSISTTIKEAIAPNGFLIDYANFELVKIFTEELKKYLIRERITYLITNPMFKYMVYNNKNIVIENNSNILDNLYKLHYQNIGYFSDFSRYDIIIENNYSINDLYNNFNRNTKRNIKNELNMGIKLHKDSTELGLEKAYEMFKKKSKKDLGYYKNLFYNYNSKNNKMEIFFASLNPHKYLMNVKKMYEKELEKNEKISDKFNNKNGIAKEKLLNKKINSDSTLEKLKNELNRATVLNNKYSYDIIVGTSIVIRNNHEIYFLIDGYNEEFRNIHSTHILKWAIISKYYTLGYRIFNLGEVYNNYFDSTSKYHGQYIYKIGFGGNIVEYSPNLLLVINKPLFNIYSKLSYGMSILKR